MSTSLDFSLLGPTLLTKSGPKPTSEVIGNKKLIGLYFSAHWCPPCRGFTPVLAEFYDELKEEGEASADTLEIVFVSSDSDESAFNSYFGEMPWTSLPFSDERVHSL